MLIINCFFHSIDINILLLPLLTFIFIIVFWTLITESSCACMTNTSGRLHWGTWKSIVTARERHTSIMICTESVPAVSIVGGSGSYVLWRTAMYTVYVCFFFFHHELV